MQKFIFSPLSIFLVLTLILVFPSCKKADVPESVQATESYDIAALQQSVASSFGAPPEAVAYNKEEKQFVVEDDSYVTLEDALLRFGVKGTGSGVNATMHREHYYLVVPTKVSTVRIYADASVPAAWLTALDSAIASWNRTKSRVNMRRIYTPSGATTRIRAAYTGSSAIATCAYPDYYGNAGNRMAINTRFNSLPAAKKRFALTHELGHAIGLAHTNGSWGYIIEGTSARDSNSIMNSTVQDWRNFTATDLLAIRTMYPL